MKYDSSKESDVKASKLYLKKLIKAGKRLEIKEIREARTIKQNAYLHICITLFAIEIGCTIEEAKTDLKRECGFMVYKKNGKKYLKQTSKMDTKELTEFIDWIRVFAANQGCYIPTSEEYLINKYQIDKEIEIHKKYIS